MLTFHEASLWCDAEIEVRYLFHLFEPLFTEEETEAHDHVPSPLVLEPEPPAPPPHAFLSPLSLGSLGPRISGELLVCGGAGCYWSGWQFGDGSG